MFHNIVIKEGAHFIADAHDCDERSFFFDYLLHVKTNPPPQLFLMGDMLDLLVGNVRHGVLKYRCYIQLIDEIAQLCEVYYFEGNHDFNLSNLFLHVKVIPIEQQPQMALLPSGRSCALLHGDKYGNATHQRYTRMIRNHTVLWILNLLDRISHGSISKKIEQNQSHKKLCKPLSHFEALVKNKIHLYPKTDVIAEGHYHQNHDFMVSGVHYINFSSFACNQSYFSVQSSPETEFAPIKFSSMSKDIRGDNG